MYIWLRDTVRPQQSRCVLPSRGTGDKGSISLGRGYKAASSSLLDATLFARGACKNKIRRVEGKRSAEGRWVPPVECAGLPIPSMRHIWYTLVVCCDTLACARCDASIFSRYSSLYRNLEYSASTKESRKRLRRSFICHRIEKVCLPSNA